MSMREMLQGRHPFFLEGSGTHAVLCLHGFTGSPGNYRKLAPLLQKNGFNVLVPVLPGHGTQPEDMAHFTEADWIEAAENAYSKLRNQYRHVHIVGLSLGGALSCILASRHPEVDSLTLLSPCFSINPWLLNHLGISLAQAALAPESAMIPLPARKPTGGTMDECLFGYNGFPLRSIACLAKAGDLAREACTRITMPTYLLYTQADKIVDPAASRQMADAISSLKKVLVYEDCEHNLLLDPRHEEIYLQVQQFLPECRS